MCDLNSRKGSRLEFELISFSIEVMQLSHACEASTWGDDPNLGLKAEDISCGSL